MDSGGIWFFFLTDKTSYHKPQSGTKNGTTQIKRFVMMWIKWRVGWINPIDYNELRERGSLKWSRWEDFGLHPILGLQNQIISSKISRINPVPIKCIGTFYLKRWPKQVGNYDYFNIGLKRTEIFSQTICIDVIISYLPKTYA